MKKIISAALAVAMAVGTVSPVMAREARMTQDQPIWEHIHQVTNGIYTGTGMNRCSGKWNDRVRIDAEQGNMYLVTNWDRSDRRWAWFFGGFIRCHGWIAKTFVR